MIESALVTEPLISVVMCVRDGQRWLREAIDSVLSSTVPLELLVIDDASTDETPRLLRAVQSARVRVLTNDTPLGPFASANRGLEVASAPFIARLDADDVCVPGRFERQLHELERRPALSLLGTACTRIDTEGRELGPQRVPTGPDVALRATLEPPFVHSSVMWRATTGLRYAPELSIGGDFELWARALTRLEADNLDAPLVRYREWQGSLSARRRDAQMAMHDAVSWRFLSTRWPELGAMLPQHRALRRWAAGEGPPPHELIDALVSASGGARATLEAPLGTLGQPRVASR